MLAFDPAPSKDKACAAGTIRMANRVVSRLYDAFLKPSGLRVTQFTILRTVAGRGPLSVNQLAAMLVMDRTTVARELRPLERGGLIKISIDSADNRVRLAAVTGTGRATLEEAQPLWQEAQRHMAEALGEDRLSALINELKEVVAMRKA